MHSWKETIAFTTRKYCGEDFDSTILFVLREGRQLSRKTKLRLEPPPAKVKVADRPHLLTWMVSWAALIISLISLCFGGWSFYVSHKPYLKMTINLPSTVREQLEHLPTEATAEIPMLAKIVNHGNTSVDVDLVEYTLFLNGKLFKRKEIRAAIGLI